MAGPGPMAVGPGLLVAQVAEDFEHLAPGGEHPAAAALVFVHRHHEFGLRLGILALAGGRVDEPATAAELTGVGRTGGLFGGPAIDPFPGLIEGTIPILGPGDVT